MKTKDKSRKWMWWFLAAVVVFQLYFVRELLAAFALFAAVFAVVAFFVAGIYMAHKTWEATVARIAASSHPAVAMARRGAEAVEDFVRRPLRGSEAAR